MVESFQKRQKCKRPFPLLNLTRTTATNANNDIKLHQLGSGITSPIITNSMMKSNDPYMPHISPRSNSSLVSLPHQQQQQRPVRRCTNSSSPHLVTHHSRQPVTPPNNGSQQIHHHHHYYFNPPTSPTSNKALEEPKPFYNLYQQQDTTQLPPLSPPPLSPTNVSFVTASRPSWRDIKRSPTWQPASSISSSEDDDDDDDDDDEPLFHLTTPVATRPFSLLSDASEDGDDELIPIARLSISSSSPLMSAAEKYKAKVRAQLQMDDTISSSPAGII